MNKYSIKSINKKTVNRIAIIVVFSLMYISVLLWANWPQEGTYATAASKIWFEKAHVSELKSDDASPDTWTEGLRLGTQYVVLTLDSGKYKDNELEVINYLAAYGNIDLQEGTKVIVRMDYLEDQTPYVVGILNYDRTFMMGILILIFAGCLIGFGGKKGLAALVGLAFTILSIWFLLIPLIRKGVPSILAAIFLVAITTFVSHLVLNGFSKKTYISVIGCIGGVTIAGIIAYLAGQLTPINGFNMPEAEELVLRAADEGLRISGLLVSGVLIASLGAVMDVSITITAAIAELKELNTHITMKELIQSGLNIGRDAMGTMANTLILAFAGASLNMLVLFRVFDYPYIQIFNSDLMAIEIIQGISGSIGIILTVPLVTVLGAYFYSHEKQIKKSKN